jgi:hypothetical protein
MENSKYGKIVTGIGELEIIDFVQANYVDNRTITVASLEDGSYALAVENPESSGRATTSKMWLSKESTIALFSTISMHFEAKGINILDEIKQAVNSDGKISYGISDNLKKINDK